MPKRKAHTKQKKQQHKKREVVISQEPCLLLTLVSFCLAPVLALRNALAMVCTLVVSIAMPLCRSLLLHVFVIAYLMAEAICITGGTHCGVGHAFLVTYALLLAILGLCLRTLLKTKELEQIINCVTSLPGCMWRYHLGLAITIGRSSLCFAQSNMASVMNAVSLTSACHRGHDDDDVHKDASGSAPGVVNVHEAANASHTHQKLRPTLGFGKAASPAEDPGHSNISEESDVSTAGDSSPLGAGVKTPLPQTTDQQPIPTQKEGSAKSEVSEGRSSAQHAYHAQRGPHAPQSLRSASATGSPLAAPAEPMQRQSSPGTPPQTPPGPLKTSPEHWTTSASDSLPQDSSQKRTQKKGRKNRKRRGRGKQETMAHPASVKMDTIPATGAQARVTQQAVESASSRVSGGNQGAAFGAQRPHRAQQGSRAGRQGAAPGAHHPHRSSAGAQGASPAQAVKAPTRTRTTPALGSRATGRPQGGPTQQFLPAWAPINAARTQAAPRTSAWAQGAPRPASIFGTPQEELARPLVGERLEGLEAMKRRCAGNKALQDNLATLQSKTGLQFRRYIRGDGDCGYRALACAILEGAARNRQAACFLLRRMTQLHEELPSWARTAKSSQGHHVFRMMLEEMLTVDVIMAVLNDPAGSECMVLFLKAVTAAAFMKRGNDVDFMAIMQGLLDEDSMSLKAMCQHYVLPLAGNPEHENYQRQWLTEPHFRELAYTLHTRVCIHDVSLTNYCAVVMGETPSRSGIAIHLLFQGDHYETLYS